MNGKYLLDTNIVIAYTKNVQSLVDFIDGRQDAVFYASVITRIELLSFPGITEDDELVINRFLAELNLVPLNEQVEKTTINIRKTRKLKLPDAIITATSCFLGATLITLDRQLANINWPGLQIIIPN